MKNDDASFFQSIPPMAANTKRIVTNRFYDKIAQIILLYSRRIFARTLHLKKYCKLVYLFHQSIQTQFILISHHGEQSSPDEGVEPGSRKWSPSRM
jgi:hypothetical protein